MSFHAYIRKLTGGADKLVLLRALYSHLNKVGREGFNQLFLSLRGKFVALENISCKIKSGCEGHLPWPEGICTKCQPSAITLNRQVHSSSQSVSKHLYFHLTLTLHTDKQLTNQFLALKMYPLLLFPARASK